MLGQVLPRLRTERNPAAPSGKPFSKVRSRYKNLQRIGEGSFGTVYRAILNGKKVIVKVAHSSGRAGFSTMVIVRGMAEEIRALMKLQKFPFVPHLIEIGTDYFTSEDVDGISMSDELKAGMTELKGISIVSAVSVMASLLHREGIAHNDIHPGNILLTPNGVVLIDFGTAIDRAQPSPSGIGKREDFRDGIKYDISYLLDIIDIFTNWPDWPKELINTLVPIKNGYRARLERGAYNEETGMELAHDLSFIVAQLGAIRKIESIAGLSGRRDMPGAFEPIDIHNLQRAEFAAEFASRSVGPMAKKAADQAIDLIYSLPDNFQAAHAGRVRTIMNKAGMELGDLAGETLVHYSRDPFKTLRPLTYEELVKDRTQGRWEDRPDMAKKYVESRKRYEGAFRSILKKAGLPYDPKKSFLYYTILGKHLLEWAKGRYEHRIPLSPEVIRETFFDVVGLPKEAGQVPPPKDLFANKGLERALRLWEEYKHKVKAHKYMNMTIFPRIEVLTQKEFTPEIWRDGEKLNGLGIDPPDISPNLPAPKFPPPVTIRIKLLHDLIDDAETTASWESDIAGAKEKLLAAWKATKAVTLEPVSEEERVQAQEILDKSFPYALGTILMATAYIKAYGPGQGRPDIESMIRDSFPPNEE